jgi:hypothetical protein
MAKPTKRAVNAAKGAKRAKGIKDTKAILAAIEARNPLNIEFIQTGSGATAVDLDTLFRKTVYTPKMFGAVCDGITDDTKALQRTIDALPPGGGIVYTPPGTTLLLLGTITVVPNVTFLGAGNKDEIPPNASIWNYAGTGARFIDARDSRGFRIEGMRILYSSASFTGSLIDLSSATPGAAVAAYCTIRNCVFEPDTDRTGRATLVNLGCTVDALIEGSFFRHGAPAVLGQISLNQNVRTTIRQNTFVRNDNVCISSGGESWILEGNSFEPLSSGLGEAFANISSLPCHGMTWIGNWFGDVTTGGTSWIDGYFEGLIFTGNQMAGQLGIDGTGITLRNSSGVRIDGNRFELLTNAVNAATAGTGLKMGTNTFVNVTTPVANASNVTADDFTLASTGITSISPQAVTYAKMQNVSATARLLGRANVGAGPIEEITIGGGLSTAGTVISLSTTLPAHTLGGTVSGGGNQINNVIIGTIAPLAGSFTTVQLSRAYGSGPQIDYSGQTTNTLPDGGTATICASTVYGKILISEFGGLGDTAEYLISGTGNIVLQTSVNGGFVAPTSSPAVGKMSIYIAGGNVILVNKLGVTMSYRLALTKI